MNDVTIGKGSMSGKGLYAARDFKKDDVVIKYELKPLTFEELKALPPEDYAATHNVNGQIYLYPEPVRYVSHSETPNVRNAHEQQADIALRDIGAGELITVDAKFDDVPVLKKINAILVRVPSIQEGLDFYREQLGLQTFWKKEGIASVHLGGGQLVMSTTLDPETNILVESVDHAAEVFKKAGGKIVSPPEDIPVGKLVIVEDAFGNRLTLVDFSKGFYTMDESGNVTGISGQEETPS
jgi:predicted enzyme related to lactoylglutathione lyase